MRYQNLFVAAVLAAGIFCVSKPAWADTGVGVGNNASASADLDFQVVIPEFLLFQVGTAGSVDLIEFTPTANEMANGATVVAATPASGDQGNGEVTVRVVANGGQVVLSEANDGGGNGLGTGGAISYSRIDTSTSDSNLPAPTLSDAGGGSATVAVTNNDYTNRTAAWTYTFDASNLQADPGTYTGTVTYTAATP